MCSPPHLYPTDLTDAEWRILEPLLPARPSGGRPPKWTKRQILDGLFYFVRSGCPWRLLPREYPPWPTVHHYFRRFRLSGIWAKIHTTLRERERMRQGRIDQPSGCIMDSQSVRTTSVGGIRGYDGGKKLSGRKRHILVDTLGLVLTARVHAADVQDRLPAAQPGYCWLRSLRLPACRRSARPYATSRSFDPRSYLSLPPLPELLREDLVKMY